MKRIVDRILRHVEGDEINWKLWSSSVYSPDELDGQIDAWSCGLFLLMIMQCLAADIDYKRFWRDSCKEKMREDCLDALLTLP